MRATAYELKELNRALTSLRTKLALLNTNNIEGTAIVPMTHTVEKLCKQIDAAHHDNSAVGVCPVCFGAGASEHGRRCAKCGGSGKRKKG